MPNVTRFNYWYGFTLWLVACLLFIAIGFFIPIIGFILVPLGLFGLPFTPFVRWMLLRCPCPYCEHEDIQLWYKGAYKCPRCKQQVLIFRGDKTGEYETRGIQR
jgi:hypothetical protein